MEAGERVWVKDKDGQHPGTVRYVGTVAGKAGTWAGIEWDDPHRGKNDGSVGDVRYFTCWREPASASFIKVEKLKPGISLVDAIHERYTPEVAALADMSIETAGHRRLEVLLAGRDKVANQLKQLHLVKTMTVHDTRIARPGNVSMLSRLLPNLIYLSLSHNLLGTWAQVHTIAAALPAVQTLDVSLNRLHHSAALDALDPLPHLQILVMKHCHASWADVLRVARAVPALTELYVAENDVAACAAASGDDGDEALAGARLEALLPDLQVLDLMQNRVATWTEVARLGVLPKLRKLKVSGNRLDDAAQFGDASFQQLETLLAADCGIEHWSVVEALGTLPKLRDLRLSGNPVLHYSAMGGRYEAIARLANLSVLNGAAVSRQERRDCELRYLRGVLQRVADLGDALGQQEAEQHPRLQALKDVYGDLDVVPSRSLRSAGMTLDAHLLNVDVLCAVSGEHKRSQVRVPASTTIGHFKLLCAALFGVDVNFQQITLHSGPRAGESVSHDNSLDLSYWNLENGEVLSVSQQDADEVWRRMSGTTAEAAAPSDWLLPVELRPELAGIAQDVS